MILFQKGKLYITKGDLLVGVEIYPSGQILQTSEFEKPDGTGRVLSLHEVMCKWGIYDGGCYIFPKTKVEIPVEKVVVDEPVVSIKKPIGRPKRK